MFSRLRTLSNFIRALELIDIKFKGRKFTWSNQHEGPFLARLDHFFISLEQKTVIPYSSKKLLPCTYWTQHRRSKQKPFRLENWWIQEEDFDKVIQEVWRTKDSPEDISAVWVTKLQEYRA